MAVPGKRWTTAKGHKKSRTVGQQEPKSATNQTTDVKSCQIIRLMEVPRWLACADGPSVACGAGRLFHMATGK